MKKALTVTLLFLFIGGAAAGQSMYTYQSDHYRIRSEISSDHARETADMLEAYFDLFGSYLHFDEGLLDYPFEIKIFREKDDFDTYLRAVISETRDSFVYLHYRKNPEKSELVSFYRDDEETFQKRLVHHGLIQYIKSFVDNPPLWLQKGFAVYLEKSVYNKAEGSATFAHNYGWVPYLRSRLSDDIDSIDLIPLSTLLYIDGTTANRNLEAFYAQSWAMIEFMVHSENKAYNRILWDSISALSPDLPIRDNERAVVHSGFEWVNKDTLVADFIRFIREVKTFPDLVELGMEAYSLGNYDDAEEHFLDALTLKEEHYVPHYYLGLIYYEKGEYSMAEYYYQTAMKSGGASALINYALGVNAFADKRFEDARFYLQEAKDSDSVYTDKADTLLKRIDTADRPS